MTTPKRRALPSGDGRRDDRPAADGSAADRVEISGQTGLGFTPGQIGGFVAIATLVLAAGRLLRRWGRR